MVLYLVILRGSSYTCLNLPPIWIQRMVLFFELFRGNIILSTVSFAVERRGRQIHFGRGGVDCGW